MKLIFLLVVLFVLGCLLYGIYADICPKCKNNQPSHSEPASSTYTALQN